MPGLDLARYDIATAEAMLSAGRYLYVLFCCQQGTEKCLKALIVERTGTFPPRTHDLVRLARTAGLAPTEEQLQFLMSLTKYYIGTRYPEEVATLSREATESLASQFLQKTREVLAWFEVRPT